MIKVELGFRKDWKILLALILTMLLLSLLRLPLVSASDTPLDAEAEDNVEEEITITLTNETLPPYLGKNITVLIRNITETHKESLMKIRLRRKLMLNATWSEKLRILNQTQCEMKEIIEERNREMERLREMWRQGNITKEKFLMEMNRLMLETRTRLSILKETTKEALRALQENISETNKKLAKEIVEKFQQEMKKMHEFVKDVKEKVMESIQKKRGDKYKGSG
ncbi:MAG: hypothetical protein ACUVQ0_06030 [Thermoproteota archaeon]